MFKKIFNRVVAKLQTFNRNESALQDAVGIVQALIAIVVVGAIGIYIADTTLTTTALQETDVNATGTLTFTNNTVDAENVTINSVVFEFDTSNNSVAAGHVNVNTSGNLTAQAATTALNTAINANLTVNTSVTSSRPTALTVLLTAKTAGTVGNTNTTAETIANASWTSTTLTGGLDASEVINMQTNLLDAGQTGASFIVILVIAFIGGIAMAYMFGMFGRKTK